MIADEKLINKLKAEKFDVAIIHVADICGFGLMKVLGIQSYSLFSTAFMVDPIAWISGSPNPVSYVPSAVTEFMPTMSFVQRAQNVLASAVTVGVFVYFIVPEYTTLFRKQFGQDFPDVFDMISNTSLYFINSDVFYDYPRPTMANVVFVGGLTMVEPSPLNEV